MTTDNRQIAETTNLASSTCTRDWIEIDASNEVCSETGIFYNKFCGFTFGTGFTSDNDQNLGVSSDISDILQRPHRKICGKYGDEYVLHNYCSPLILICTGTSCLETVQDFLINH